MTPTEGATRYARYWETLTPEQIGDAGKVAHPDIRFTDPFNDVRGIANFRAVLRHMFETVEEPAFKVSNIAVDGDVAFLRWRFLYGRRRTAIDGVAELRLDADGLVLSHLDHWDAASQLYTRVPVLGWIMRVVRRRLAAPAAA